MTVPTLRLALENQRDLAQEFDSNLQYGRAFAPNASGVDALDDCVLVVVHPDSAREIKLPAQAVLITPAGVGIELRPFDETIRERIREFVCGAAAGAAVVSKPVADAVEPERQEPAAEAETEAEAEAECEPETEAEAEAEAEAETQAEADAETQAEDGQEPLESDGEPDADGVQRKRPRHEELRNLNSTQQHKLARKGELNDRVILERLYGKNVWEPLLHNPRMTVPEVARIARKGTVPRPLLELIADNNTWIQASVVRRALLGNPRVTAETIMKLLRITPKHELKVIVKTTTYSTQVREAARKLLG